MYSTMRFIFNLHSSFNALFNIQLSIQHSAIHFKFNSSFTHSIIFSTTSTICSKFNYSFNIQLFIQHSTIYSTFNYSFQFIKSFEPSLLLVSDAYYCLLKTWQRRRLECRLRTQNLVKVKQVSTSMWSLTFHGFLTLFFKKTDQISLSSDSLLNDQKSSKP